MMYGLNPGIASDLSKRDLLAGDGPREKLAKWGPERLNERELLALILGQGSPGNPLSTLAETLFEKIFMPDGGVSVPTLEEFLEVNGLGRAKAAAVVASLELGKRLLTLRGRPIHCPQDALAHLSWLTRERREHFHVLYLDTRRRKIHAETISIGTLDSSLVHPREVFIPAIRHGASAILVAHNHPSGDPEPSPEDMALTRRLDRASSLLGISLVDHLILAGSDWVSLRQRQRDGATGIELFAA